MGPPDFMVLGKILFKTYLKHSSFWPLADFKQAPNDLLYVTTWQGMFALSLSMCLTKIFMLIGMKLEWIRQTLIGMFVLSACILSGNPYWRGRLSTIDLLVLTSFWWWKSLFTYLRNMWPCWGDQSYWAFRLS
jgi:hypothetical protein